MSYFGNVYESVKSRFKFNECAVFLDLYDLSFNDLTYFVVVVDHAPRLRLVLLESERDLALLAVHSQYLHVDLLTDAQNFLRMLELAP